MWIRRRHYEHLFHALATARERIVQLERMDAAHTSTVEWLRVHVNRLEAERAILTRERLQVDLPQPVLDREAASPREAPPAGPMIAGIPVENVTKGLPDDSVALAHALSSTLEDIGDEAARALGIHHADDGRVIYDR